MMNNDPMAQDMSAYADTPGLLDAMKGSGAASIPVSSMDQIAPAMSQDQWDGSSDLGVDTQVQLLEAILQELRTLNQNFRNL